MMQALEQLWLAKGTSWDELVLISEKNQACSHSHYRIIELRLC